MSEALARKALAYVSSRSPCEARGFAREGCGCPTAQVHISVTEAKKGLQGSESVARNVVGKLAYLYGCWSLYEDKGTLCRCLNTTEHTIGRAVANASRRLVQGPRKRSR